LEQYLKMVSMVARQVSHFEPKDVALEPFNEPVACEHSVNGAWAAAQEKIYRTSRENAPKVTLVLTGDCWGTTKGLPSVNAEIFDENTFFSIHFYDPYLFTNQGSYSGNAYTNYVNRIHFPPVSADRPRVENELTGKLTAASIDDDTKAKFGGWAKHDIEEYFKSGGGLRPIETTFQTANAWAKEHKINPSRIFVGEFGVRGEYDGHLAAEPADRAAWLAAVRTASEKYNFNWAVYSIVGPYGIETGGLDLNGPFAEPLIKALGLHSK
ncbi:MAG: glycoside hydrolase family 5 protein, partial [Pseudomonadota bacterium]|nr:glycoside hydrolase family 5 protein [Pseudomonadota bacterium]